MPLLIGITGKARSGKDTLADYLYKVHEFTKMSFAGPLKQAALAAFSEYPSNFMTQEGKAGENLYWKMTRRKMLQDFGECMCKQFGEDFWIKRWFIDYARLRYTDDIVITDVRKDIEAHAVRRLGGFIIHMYRDSAGLGGEEGQHITEQGVRPFDGDLIIDNNGTIEDLRQSAKAYLHFLRSQRRG